VINNAENQWPFQVIMKTIIKKISNKINIYIIELMKVKAAGKNILKIR